MKEPKAESSTRRCSGCSTATYIERDLLKDQQQEQHAQVQRVQRVSTSPPSAAWNQKKQLG